ncbi:MAG: tetratricopeptide repeat protein, partial [Planctomycetota bacterium]|nr:tetratricopeptide repeat protein [Planctomycetota bacterium]
MFSTRRIDRWAGRGMMGRVRLLTAQAVRRGDVSLERLTYEALRISVFVAWCVTAAWCAAAEPLAADAAAEETVGQAVAAAKPATPLLQAKVAMQGKAWDQALKLLEAQLQTKAPDADEAQYLQALVLHYQGHHDRAIAAAQRVLMQYKNSVWRQKAMFLTAQAMVQQKNYRGAEEIYEAETLRLLGAARKHEVAGVLVKFADAMATQGDPHDVAALPPNYAKAGNLYRKALAMEIGRDLKDEVMFKLGRTGQLAEQPPEAIKDFQAYLQEFDPNWTGPIGSQERALNQKKKSPPPAGQRVLAARYRLAEAMLAAGQAAQARLELEDLQKLLAGPGKQGADAPRVPRGTSPFSTEVDAGDVAWLVVQTYGMPAPSAQELDKAVQAAADFLARFGRHPQAVQAAYGIAEAYRSQGRLDQAVSAFESFIAGKGFALPPGNLANRRLDGVPRTPAELQEELTRQAVFQIGQIRFLQRHFDKAIQQWQTYITRYPNGPQWAESQKGIVNAEFQIALAAVAANKVDPARELLASFLTRHPLDERVPQALFIFGQIPYAAAQKLEQDKAENAAIQKAYRAAIVEWSKLVSRFPAAEESSLAQYRIGLIHEEKLAELAQAIDAYRKLNWGSQAPAAAGRVAVMTQKALTLRTERLFRSNEPVRLKLGTRNIERLTVKLYRLDLQSYFRKTHGVASVEALDIALIQPDKTWEFQVAGYAKYKPIDQELAVPCDPNLPGVSIVNVSEEDLEATTLVIRSDIDLILKSSRRETLVFVQDMVKRQPVEGAELLLSDGQKVIATGKTGKDGVLRAKLDGLKTAETLRVMAKLGSHVAADAVTLAGSEALDPRLRLLGH